MPVPWTLTPLTGHFAAEIRDIDLKAAVDADLREALVGALDRHQVLFFPGQFVDHDRLVSIAKLFGEVEKPVRAGENVPRQEVREFVSQPVEWHADITWRQRPPGEQIFRVVELPPLGGDTLWASTQVAYDRLAPGLRDLIDRLEAVHDDNLLWLRHGNGGMLQTEEVRATHPIVRIHPRTGRRSIFVNPMYTSAIKGLSELESRHLLALLFEHVQRPEHFVRYRWSPGTLAIWDNRNTWHYAVGDYGDQRRRVQRVSTLGERPGGIDAAAVQPIRKAV